MSTQEIEAEVDSATDEVETNETGEDNWTPDNASRNKSNFKQLAQALKAERAEKAELARAKAEMEEELNAWRSENPDLVTQTLTKKSWASDKWELALFLVTNPEAKEHLKEVQEFANDTGYDLEKAWKYVKPTIQVESKTEKDFEIKWKSSKSVDLTKITLEETADLTPAQRSEWRKIHWKD